MQHISISIQDAGWGGAYAGKQALLLVQMFYINESFNRVECREFKRLDHTNVNDLINQASFANPS